MELSSLELSSFIRVGQYKSPLRVVAGILLRSRETQAERARQKSEEIERLRRLIQQQQRDLDKANEDLAVMKRRIAQLEIENDGLRRQPPVLPHDPVLPKHEFGPKMISVCVNLAMKVGLRASITCLKTVMDWLGASVRLPTWTTVRTWLMRLGVAALTPVSPKPKARFMNLSATLNWASMVLWHLSHPLSIARQTIPTSRMNNKLGWLRKYRADIFRWSRCQKVVSTGVTFVNEQGVFRGAADQLARLLVSLPMCEASQTVVSRLLEFIREHEAKLTEGQRLPMSTEILESCFGLFKQLERQHSKGGFTSLLAAFGALLKPATPESIRADFARVSVQQMKTWVSQNLGATLASKRQTAYAEFKNAA